MGMKVSRVKSAEKYPNIPLTALMSTLFDEIGLLLRLENTNSSSPLMPLPCVNLLI